MMTTYFWLYMGVGLIILEILTPGFVVLFFGLSALTVALITWLFPNCGPTIQWGAFSALSILYVVGLRKLCKQIFAGKSETGGDPDDDFTGGLVTVTETIAPGKRGRVEYRGTTWDAESGRELAPGATARITGKKNLTLIVETT